MRIEAEYNFKLALARWPNHVASLLSLGSVYIHQGRYAEAIIPFERSVALDSVLWDGWIGLGAAYGLDKQVPQADSVYVRLLAKDSALADQMLQAIAIELERQKKSSDNDDE